MKYSALLKLLIGSLLTVLVLSACLPGCKIDYEERAEYDFPVFIDTNKLEVSIADINWINDGNHNPLYFGYLADTIEVEKAYGRIYGPPPPRGSKESIPNFSEGKYSDYFLKWEDFRSYVGADSVRLTILIDTSQFITNEGRKAYPVIIKNLHFDTVYVGYGRYIPIITEALNEKGEWEPIEERYRYLCGTGLERIILPPKQIVVTSQLVYSGSFKTKLRIKYGSNYSREFVGFINPTQFKHESS